MNTEEVAEATETAVNVDEADEGFLRKESERQHSESPKLIGKNF